MREGQGSLRDGAEAEGGCSAWVQTVWTLFLHLFLRALRHREGVLVLGTLGAAPGTPGP